MASGGESGCGRRSTTPEAHGEPSDSSDRVFKKAIKAGLVLGAESEPLRVLREVGIQRLRGLEGGAVVLDDLFKRREAAIVHVGGAQSDVPQRWGAEFMPITRFFGGGFQSEVIGWREPAAVMNREGSTRARRKMKLRAPVKPGVCSRW